MDGENPNGRLDWGLVSERVGLRLKQEYGAENWNCLAVLPSGLRHWGMPYLILRVDDAAVDRRQSVTHLLIPQPGPAKQVSSSDAATCMEDPPAPAAPVVIGLIRFNAQCAFWALRWPYGQKLKSKNTLSDGKKMFLRLFFLCCFRKKTLKLVSLFFFRH